MEIAKVKNIDFVLSDLDSMVRTAPVEAWVIRYHGNTLKLRSGKNVWKKVNHAKAAFANHLSDVYSWKDIRSMGFKDGTELSHYLQNIGLIKVEKL